MLRIPQHQKNLIRFCSIVLVCLALVACGRAPVSEVRPAVDTPHIKTLLLLPFQDMRTTGGEHTTVRCAICGMVVMTGPLMSRDGAFLSEALVTKMQADGRYTIITGVLSDIANGQTEEQGTTGITDKGIARRALMEAGRQHGADAILTGHLYRLRERVGAAYGVSQPASVAFDLHLISVQDGRLIWAGQFDETQRSLSEDLWRVDAFLRRGASWLTAEALALDGLTHIIAKMPKP